MVTISSQEAFETEKPVVVFTCRVHPGETPGQYMLQGIIEKLMEFDDAQTQILLKNYVFKIIPCLNPDGVARGSWRFDTNGQNLNRKFYNPDGDKEPTVLAAKKVITDQHAKGKLKMYMDFHAHKSKRGCFIYGTNHSDSEILAETMLFPKLMSLNCVNFDYMMTSFLEPSTDELLDGRSREAISTET